MAKITLSLKDETVEHLRRDFDVFVRLTLKLDPAFATPTFEDFLRAKMLDNMVPLTEQAVQQLLKGGQYAWAKRTLDKEVPDLVGSLVRQAKEFGFGFAAPSNWTAEEMTQHCTELASAIVNDPKADAAVLSQLAAQIESAVQSIQKLEAEMQTPAWKLAESLRQRAYEAKVAVESSFGSIAREKLGELRGILRLGIAHGYFQLQEAQQLMEYLRYLRPELFVDETVGIYTRFSAWLRRLFFEPVIMQPPPPTTAPPRRR